MEFLSLNWIVEHLARFFIIIIGIIFAIILGRYRPEWRSRKTLICWIWTIIAADIVIMDGDFALSRTAQLFIGGALLLNVVNFIGDRIETIKFKDFTMNLDGPDKTTVPFDFKDISKITPIPPTDASGVPLKPVYIEGTPVKNTEGGE